MSFQMHPCPHCPAEFDSLKSLEHHLKASHNETLPDEKFRCVTCDAEFMSQMEWLDHSSEHEPEAEAEPAPQTVAEAAA
jgi:uncharacterized C2H2 Zn-finger protein